MSVKQSVRYVKLFFLISLFIMVFFIIAGCNGLFSPVRFKASRFGQIQITDQNNLSSIIADENELSFWIEAFNNSVQSDSTTLPTGELQEYRVTLEGKKERYTKTLSLYVESIDTPSLYALSGDEHKMIDHSYAVRILSNPVFDPLYSNRVPPKVCIGEGADRKDLQPSNYEWKYRKADMNFYDANLAPSEKNETLRLTITDSLLPAINAEEEPDNMKLEFLQNEEVVYTTTENGALDLEDGSYQCCMELYWFEDLQKSFYGSAIYRFNVEIDNPPEFEISENHTYPGELLVIKAYHINEEDNLSVQTNIDFEPHIFGKGSEKTILIPVSYYHQDGKTYTITVSAGNISETFDVDLLKKDFITQYLTIDTKIAAATRNEKSAQEVVDKINPLKPVCDEEQYWEGPFLQPVDGGRVSPEDFGKRRYVNNAPTSYRHNGLDIGQDQGTPIKAVNNGRVLLAEYLIGTGNTVIIEHGYGLKSWYYHMESLNTKKGDMIKKGDIIGLVGSTGFSTCPHLHLSISVNHVYVNPMPFFENGVPLAD